MTAEAPPEHHQDPAGVPAPDGSRGWRPALRIAGRTVRRNLGRSLLVAALVAIPVAGATLVDGVYRSTDNPERDAYQAIGNADALVVVAQGEPLSESWVPDPHSYVGVDPGDTQRDPAEVDLDELLPAGTELTPASRTYWNTRVVRGAGTTSARVVAAEMNDPATEHLVRLESGRWPANDDEVLVSEPLAERLGLLENGDLAAGATVTLPDGPTVDATGIGLHPQNLAGGDLFAAPGSVVVDHLHRVGAVGQWSLLLNADPGSDAYLASLPDGADAEALWLELAERGVALVPRAAYLDPDAYTNSAGSGPVSAQTLQLAAAFALMVGLGLLEVILLAGAAFAVGARRQVRDLGLVAAGGGTSAHVRRIVLAQGLVLGAIGATLGVAAGVALTIAGRPLWQSFDNALIETWRWGEIEIAIAAAVGLLSGLAAAVVPAIGAARRNPIDALAQRFRTTPMTAHLPKLGVLLLVVGASGALAASRALVADIRAYAESLRAAGNTAIGVGSPNETGYVALQLLGVVIAVAGLILLIPFVVTWVARRVRRSPVAARFAARDAARHRHRTAPAVAAIMIVVAGASGVAYALAAQEDADRLRYTPSLPNDVLELSPGVDLIDPAVADAVADELPDATVLMVEGPAGGVSAYPDGTERHNLAYVNADCIGAGAASAACSGALKPLTIASPALVELAYGEGAEDDVRSALDDGHVIVPSDGFASADGTVAIEAFEPEAIEPPEPVHLPAHVLNPDTPHYDQVPLTLVSARAADAAGWDIVPMAAFIRYDPGAATEDDLDNAYDVADRHGYDLMAEQGPPSMRMGFVALAAGAGLVTLVGVGVVVSLAAAEGRSDLATMAAVGAPPRRRRAIAGWQALFVAGLGSVLGLALGTYYGYLAYPVYGVPEFVVPWLTVAAVGVGVPLLAALVAMLFTRSRLPMVRRIE